jgi:hypothetical protein
LIFAVNREKNEVLYCFPIFRNIPKSGLDKKEYLFYTVAK